jgi:hypothetical protein
MSGRRLRSLVFAAALLGAGGCASMINGRTQWVRLETEPPGATLVLLPGGRRLTSPADVEVSRDRVRTVQATLEGYEPARGYLDRKISALIYGNIVVGGFIGMSIDMNTGAAFRLAPDPLRIRMVPLANSEVGTPDTAADQAATAGTAAVEEGVVEGGVVEGAAPGERAE